MSNIFWLQLLECETLLLLSVLYHCKWDWVNESCWSHNLNTSPWSGIEKIIASQPGNTVYVNVNVYVGIQDLMCVYALPEGVKNYFLKIL